MEMKDFSQVEIEMKDFSQVEMGMKTSHRWKWE
jgi:hypothetical protein